MAEGWLARVQRIERWSLVLEAKALPLDDTRMDARDGIEPSSLVLQTSASPFGLQAIGTRGWDRTTISRSTSERSAVELT